MGRRRQNEGLSRGAKALLWKLSEGVPAAELASSFEGRISVRQIYRYAAGEQIPNLAHAFMLENDARIPAEDWLIIDESIE